MKLLLDTSIMVRLGASTTPVTNEVKQAILNAELIYVTPIARAEIGIKVSIGKLELPSQEKTYWDSLATRLQARDLPFTVEHAALLSSLPLIHRDPFDRMIAAQCLVEGLSLATTDSVFAQYGVQTVG